MVKNQFIDRRLLISVCILRYLFVKPCIPAN